MSALAFQLPRAVLFDLDGTLTVPMLDFPRIKAEMGIGHQAILESLETMSANRRATAEAILLRHEEEAALGSSLNDGCIELLEWLRDQRVRLAIITRNSALSLNTIVKMHGIQVTTSITREECRYKPDPAPLLLACERLGVDPHEAWMVGDGRYDVQAGLAAGVRTVWISHGRDKTFEEQPWTAVSGLGELLSLLQSSNLRSVEVSDS